MTFCLVWAPNTFYRHIKKKEEKKIFRVNISMVSWVVVRLGIFKWLSL